MPRTYLLDRFRTDADVLRQRAESLRSGPPQPGPDAATSLRMADACGEVIAMIDAIPESDDASAMIGTLTALVPLLEQRAAAASGMPPVRAVYAGAATRIREVADAEARHLRGDNGDEPVGDDMNDDMNDGMNDEDDEA